MVKTPNYFQVWMRRFICTFRDWKWLGTLTTSSMQEGSIRLHIEAYLNAELVKTPKHFHVRMLPFSCAFKGWKWLGTLTASSLQGLPYTGSN